YTFYRRARRKGFAQANVRAGLYAASGCAIVLSIGVLGVNALTQNAAQMRIPRLTFYGEAVGLIAFGISWVNASHVLPVLNREDERFSPISDRNPEERERAAERV